MSGDPFDFEEDDHTVLQPASTPASASTGLGSNRAQPTTAAGTVAGRRTGPVPLLGGINRLEHAASRLLPLLITIKSAAREPDPSALRDELVREIDTFRREARSLVDEPKQATQASYVLCTALDEAAMNTPWGHRADWSQYNLLSTFHGEVAGGERFFTLLKGLGKDPARNIELLELMYLCLALGYEGSYRIKSNGRQTLAKVRAWLHELIRGQRGTAPVSLSAHWQGTEAPVRRLPRSTGIWVATAVALGIAAAAFTVLRTNLGLRAETGAERVLSASVAPLSVRSVAPPERVRIETPTGDTATRTLSELLQDDIAAGELDVTEGIDRGLVRIGGDNAFASGSATIEAATRTLIERVGRALDEFGGSIRVAGHSDNVPIRSGRFASNLELSQVRADAVRDVLAGAMTDASRVNAEGRGSLEPLADNATPGGRRLNRRVDITLFY